MSSVQIRPLQPVPSGANPIKRYLLLGAGNSRVKKIAHPDSPGWDGELVTLDMNPACGADVVHDVEQRPLPFADESFDEIHAYDCLEHWGRQGDWRAWFDEMAEYHRLLKPGGTFFALVPIEAEAFADPGHTRFFSTNHFGFLNQDWYDEKLAAGAPVTDYRWYWKKNFGVIVKTHEPSKHLIVVLNKQ